MVAPAASARLSVALVACGSIHPDSAVSTTSDGTWRTCADVAAAKGCPVSNGRH